MKIADYVCPECGSLQKTNIKEGFALEDVVRFDDNRYGADFDVADIRVVSCGGCQNDVKVVWKIA
jgi:hypothetical protein